MLFEVDDMSCDHCVATIEKAVLALDPGAIVKSDLKTRTVDVTSSAEPSAIRAALEEAGYESRA